MHECGDQGEGRAPLPSWSGLTPSNTQAGRRGGYIELNRVEEDLPGRVRTASASAPRFWRRYEVSERACGLDGWWAY